MNLRWAFTGIAATLAACSHTPPADTKAAQTTSATPPAACMQLQVSRLQVSQGAGQGTVMAAAYGSAEGFFKKPVWSGSAKADRAEVTLSVCGVADGEVAFTVFQDLNGNGKLDMNPMGVPTEPYGFSGKPVFGPPSWEASKVAAGAGRVVRIEL